MMQSRMSLKPNALFSLYQFADSLSGFTVSVIFKPLEDPACIEMNTNFSQSRGESHDFMYWHRFVEQFYAPSGSLRQGVWDAGQGRKQFEILTPALPRYYYTQFNSGIKHIQMIVEGAKEKDMSNGGRLVESDKTSFIYWFANDCQVCLPPFLSHFVLYLLGDTNSLF